MLFTNYIELQSEFEAISAEVDLPQRLANLDKLCAEGVPAPAVPWTHTLQLEIQAEIVRAKRMEEEKLRTILATMTADNDSLESEVAAMDDAAKRLCAMASTLQSSIGEAHVA